MPSYCLKRYTSAPEKCSAIYRTGILRHLYLCLCVEKPTEQQPNMSREYKTPKQVIYVCTGDKCKKRGGKDAGKAFRELCKSYGLKNDVEIIKTDCTDRCKLAPVVCIQPQNLWLYEVNEHKEPQLFQQHVLNAQKKDDLSKI